MNTDKNIFADFVGLKSILGVVKSGLDVGGKIVEGKTNRTLANASNISAQIQAYKNIKTQQEKAKRDKTIIIVTIILSVLIIAIVLIKKK